MDDRLNIIRGKIIEERKSGTSKSLIEYTTLFPGEDALVARAFADVFGTTDADSPAAPSQDSIGHYRILKELGRGGQGVVYLALDTRLHRKVALKVLTGLGPGSEDSVHRLRREAEVASKLEHPGICGVHDAGVANGTPFIAMQYVEGTTLAERISAARSAATAGEPSSVVMFSQMTDTGLNAESSAPSPSTTALTTRQEIPAILRVFEKAAQALHAAHEAGVVHRDIKPGNIMVSASGLPVILDFGLARAEDMDLQTLTRTGDVFGTPAYMSPEQISGQRIRLDRRSDVYSLGVTLYECLTLRRPFEAPTREGVYQAVMTKNPPDPRKINPAISKDLTVVIETALEKDRDRRYATADALAKDLQAVLDGRPIQARPVGPVGRFVRWSKREPAKAALLGVLLVALPVIASLVTSHVKDQPQVEAARTAKIEQAKDELLSEASYEVSEGDPVKAVALYTQVLEMEGVSPEAAGGLVLANLKLKNATVALQLLDQHRRLLGEGAAAHLLRADTLRDLGRQDEANAIEQAAPAPLSAFEHHLLAEKELQKGEAGDKPAFGRALSHATTAILLSSAPRLSLYTLRAHAAGHAKNRDASIETANVLRRLWPDSASSLRWCGFALAVLEDPALLDDAIAVSRQAIRLKPDLGGAYATLGGALRKKGLVDDAIACFRDDVRLNPNVCTTHSNLGNALADKGLLDEAIAEYREAIRLKPVAEVYQDLGVALAKRGLLDDAIASLREATRMTPAVATAHANLGNALALKGLDDDAISSFREAIRLGLENAGVQSYLGELLVTRGRIDEGIAAYREAIRLNPDDADSHLKLGKALGLLERRRESLAEIRRGHEIGSRQPGWSEPSEQWIADAQQRVDEEEELETKLAAHLATRTTPEGAHELVALARVALDQNHSALAARWYQLASEAAPDSADAIDPGYRRRAARAAVLTSIGGTDSAPALDDAARATWRLRALAWLEADLAGIKKASETKRSTAPEVRIALVPLVQSPDFASVRGLGALARLPEAERARWTKLWADLDAFLAALDSKPETR